jgi:hypothetical protein
MLFLSKTNEVFSAIAAFRSTQDLVAHVVWPMDGIRATQASMPLVKRGYVGQQETDSQPEKIKRGVTAATALET